MTDDDENKSKAQRSKVAHTRPQLRSGIHHAIICVSLGSRLLHRGRVLSGKSSPSETSELQSTAQHSQQSAAAPTRIRVALLASARSAARLAHAQPTEGQISKRMNSPTAQ